MRASQPSEYVNSSTPCRQRNLLIQPFQSQNGPVGSSKHSIIKPTVSSTSFLLSLLVISFSDVYKLLRTTKDDGRMKMQVMTHVVIWLNLDPVSLLDWRKNNKPLLQEDLVPHFQRLAASGAVNNAGSGNVEIQAKSYSLKYLLVCGPYISTFYQHGIFTR